MHTYAVYFRSPLDPLDEEKRMMVVLANSEYEAKRELAYKYPYAENIQVELYQHTAMV